MELIREGLFKLKFSIESISYSFLTGDEKQLVPVLHWIDHISNMILTVSFSLFFAKLNITVLNFSYGTYLPLNHSAHTWRILTSIIQGLSRLVLGKPKGGKKKFCDNNNYALVIIPLSRKKKNTCTMDVHQRQFNPNTFSKYIYQIMRITVDLSITVTFMVPSNRHIHIYHAVFHLDQQ